MKLAGQDAPKDESDSQLLGEIFILFLWLGNRARTLTVDSTKPRAKPLSRLTFANSQLSNNLALTYQLSNEGRRPKAEGRITTVNSLSTQNSKHTCPNPLLKTPKQLSAVKCQLFGELFGIELVPAKFSSKCILCSICRRK